MTSEKRLHMSIGKKFIHMDNIIKDCQNKKISVSDYLCSLAEKDYLSKKNNDNDIPISKIDELTIQVFRKKDISEELSRLFNNKVITEEDIITIYLKIYGYKIQIENTDFMSDILQIEDIGDIIYSKRDTMSELALKKAKGILVNRMEILKLEKEQQLEKERREIEIIDWKLKYNNKYPLIFKKLYKPEEYEEQLKIYSDSLLTEKEVIQLENIYTEKKEEQKLTLSVMDMTDDDINNLLIE